MKYRKKPVVIEAFQWTLEPEPDWFKDSLKDGIAKICNGRFGYYVEIRTLEGTHKAPPGDYIIKGIEGELYPCKPDIFERTYEKVEEEQ